MAAPVKPLEQEALDRIAEARKQKIMFERDLREGYFFAAPHRARNVLSTVKPASVKPQDAAELNTSFAMELCGDFPTVVINTFCPQSEPWVVSKPSAILDDTMAADVASKAKIRDRKVFEGINGSNFYEACGEGFNPDLALGVVAMWIDRRRLTDPIRCQPIPIRELEINLGPFGGVDDRFVVRHTRNRHAKTLLGEHYAKLNAEQRKIIEDKPNEHCRVTWGYWRDWEKDYECWQFVLMFDEKLVHDAKLEGVGSCPLVIGRFGASPEWAWCAGPLVQALPDLRGYDALTEGKIRNLDQSLNPAIAFPDDSFTNIENGIESGMAYAIRPGSEGAVKNIYTPNQPDAAIYETMDKETRLKRLFFLDQPDQRGKTPPTATQWLDEMVMAQRRIGTPGFTFWASFCAESFNRTGYLLEKAGVIEKVEVNGKAITLTPYNPAQRAADQQEVAQAARAIELTGQAFPEEFKVRVDGGATIDRIVAKLGAEDVIVMRKPEDIKNAIGQISQLMGGATPGAPAVPGGAPIPAGITGPDAAQATFRGKV